MGHDKEAIICVSFGHFKEYFHVCTEAAIGITIVTPLAMTQAVSMRIFFFGNAPSDVPISKVNLGPTPELPDKTFDPHDT